MDCRGYKSKVCRGAAQSSRRRSLRFRSHERGMSTWFAYVLHPNGWEKPLGISSVINSKLLANSELKALLGAQLTRKIHDFIPDVDSLVSEEVISKLVPASERDGTRSGSWWTLFEWLRCFWIDWKYIDEVDIVTRICVRTINHVLIGTRLREFSADGVFVSVDPIWFQILN